MPPRSPARLDEADQCCYTVPRRRLSSNHERVLVRVYQTLQMPMLRASTVAEGLGPARIQYGHPCRNVQVEYYRLDTLLQVIAVMLSVWRSLGST